MSKVWRLGFVVEGKTDFIVFSGLVSHWLGGNCELNQLQPDTSGIQTDLGMGWSGVYQWCRQVVQNNQGNFYADPLFSVYDALFIHLDGDVAFSDYNDANIHEPCGLPLPCVSAGASGADVVENLQQVLGSWCAVPTFLPGTIPVVPVMATESWIYTSLFPAEPIVVNREIERNPDPSRLFIGLGGGHKLVRNKDGKSKKVAAAYTAIIPELIAGWENLSTQIEEAALFREQVRILNGAT
jgi:hypothetical protein